eukprot:403350703
MEGAVQRSHQALNMNQIALQQQHSNEFQRNNDSSGIQNNYISSNANQNQNSALFDNYNNFSNNENQDSSTIELSQINLNHKPSMNHLQDQSQISQNFHSNLVSGESTLKNKQIVGFQNSNERKNSNFSRQNSQNQQNLHFNHTNSSNTTTFHQVKQTRNPSLLKQTMNPISNSGQIKDSQQRNINNNSSSSGLMGFNGSGSVRKIDRVYNQLLTQSMQNGLTYKNSQGFDLSNEQQIQQRQTNTSHQHQHPPLHHQISMPVSYQQQQPSINYQQLMHQKSVTDNNNGKLGHAKHPSVKRERCESVGQSKTFLSSKDRNCKTSSPHQLHQMSIGGPYPSGSGYESRMRKRSKELMKNKEQFADLIVVLGIKYDEFIEQERVKPQVVGGYPDLNDKEFVKKHNYVENLIWICFPEGFSIQAFEKKRDGELCQMKIFHFIITNQDGDKKYITSILFKELFLNEKKGAFIVILDINALSIKAFAKERSNYLTFLKDQTQENIQNGRVDTYLMKKIEFYLSIFFNHLYYCEEVDQDIEIEEIRERQLPVGHQHTNKCGAQCNKKRHKQKEKIVDSYFRFRNTKTYGFTLENYSFELLLQSLKPERILFLITALLLERKIILIKKNFGDIALIMESLVSLLNPLKWNFVFITYLTPKLVECLEAPFPYIIGVSRKVWDDWCVMREFPDEIIIFDIDNQKLLNQVREELPPLPQPQASVLQRSLKDMLDIKERFIETIQENATKKVAKDKMEEYYWAYAQIRVKQSFFNFFLLTINNYIGYFKNLDEEGNLSPNKKDKQFYDKLSSNDVFDFDNYLNQFEGGNKEFMEKFVKTQSFHNFIEETYKNTTPQSVIGFFQTNLEVMIDYSFKKLKKEQNKLLDKTFFNLQNPVKFNIGHMYRQYKKQLIMKHAPKFKKMLEQELELSDPAIMNSDPAKFDIYQRQDFLERFLQEEIDSGVQKIQISILNGFKLDLVTSMPGIQYEQISAYEQIKSQRSDQSQDHRRLQNKTVVKGNSGQYGLDLQQSSLSLIPGSNVDRSVSVVKSRNQQKIVNSRSGDLVTKSQTLKHGISFGAHKRSQGGMIYDNFLSMANNKNTLQMSQDFNDIQDMLNEQKNVIVTKQNMMNEPGQDIQHINEKIYNKYRVNSENKYHHPSFSLNKTIDLNNINHRTESNLHNFRQKAQTQQQNINSGSKQRNNTMKKLSSNGTRNHLLHQSQVLPSINSTYGQIKQAISPKVVNENGSFKRQNANGSTGSFYKERQVKQQSVLKEALNRQIQRERSKVGLQNQQSQKDLDTKRQFLFANNVSNLFSPNNRSLANITSGNATQTYQNNFLNESGNKLQLNSSNSKLIPQSQIDLMNPKKSKKLSRNEERKLAMKKGFMNPQQHESFYHQFVYSPNEELNKLAYMQIIQRKVENGQLKLGNSKDKMSKDQMLLSFSNLMNNQGGTDNYNSNMSEQEFMQRLNQVTQANNQIQFQRRILQDPDLFQANDLFLTTIKNQNNFIQQKNQIHQSPSITNTELSSIRKGERMNGEGGQFGSESIALQNDDFNDEVIIDSASPDYKRVNNMQSNPLPSGQHKKNESQQILTKNIQLKLQGNQRGQVQLSLTKSLKESSLTQILRSVKQSEMEDQYKQFSSQSMDHGDENLDSIEARPLKIMNENDELNILARTNVINLKHSNINENESPDALSKNQHFKFQSKNAIEKKIFNNNNINQQVTVRKDFKAVNPNNKVQNDNQKAYKNQRDKLVTQNMHSNQLNMKIARDKSLKAKGALNRKRSTPALANEKSPQVQTFKMKTKPQNLIKQKSGGPLDSNSSKTINSNSQYFKQRPLNQTSKAGDMKLSQVSTTVVDLGHKNKFGNDQSISQMDQSKDMYSLRISPIPNLNQILNQQQSKINQQNLNYDLQNQQQYNSSSGVSDDQVIIKQHSDSNQINQNRGSLFHTNNHYSSNINPLSLNYQSRISDKSINNQAQEHMFASMSHILDQDLFEKAHHTTINGPQTARNESIQSKQFANTTQSKFKNQVYSMSQRSLSNLHKNNQNFVRTSHISGEGTVRPSNTSSKNDLFKFKQEKANKKLKLETTSNRNSDILSQYEPQNNISISILKSSPRMMTKNMSRTTKNTQDNVNLNARGSARQNTQNFMISGNTQSNIDSLQQSALTSHDTQNMKTILNALKQNLPQTKEKTLKNNQNNNSNTQNVNIVNIDLNKHKQVVFSPKGLSGQKMKDILTQSNSSAAKMMLRNSSIEEVKRNINMSLEQTKKDKTPNQVINSNNSTMNLQQRNFNSSQQNANNSVGTNMINQKQARSPQPNNLNHQSSTNSNNGQTKNSHKLQSQEFNLKDKNKRASNQINEIQNFMSDPMVALTKENNKSNKKQKISSSNLQAFKSGSKLTSSSNKNLRIDISDTQIKELNFNSYMQNNSLIKSPSQKVESSIMIQQNHQPYSTNTIRDNQDSTAHQQDPILQKQRLLDEINGVNQALNKLEENKKRYKLILEETLNSQSNNSNASYQTSPKNFLNFGGNVQEGQHENNNAKKGAQTTQVFKTLKNHASDRIGGSHGGMNTNEDSSQNLKDMTTARNIDYPFRNFNEESRINALAAKESMLIYQTKAKYQESTDELDYDNQDTDFQLKLGQQDFLNDQSIANNFGDQLTLPFTKHQSVSQVERLSKLNQEIDQLMNNQPVEHQRQQNFQEQDNYFSERQKKGKALITSMPNYHIILA